MSLLILSFVFAGAVAITSINLIYAITVIIENEINYRQQPDKYENLI